MTELNRQGQRPIGFKDAMDTLGLPATAVARALGCSVQTIRQARLGRGAKGWRSPPVAWKRVLLRLTRERAQELVALLRAFKEQERETRKLE